MFLATNSYLTRSLAPRRDGHDRLRPDGARPGDAPQPPLDDRRAAYARRGRAPLARLVGISQVTADALTARYPAARASSGDPARAPTGLSGPEAGGLGAARARVRTGRRHARAAQEPSPAGGGVPLARRASRRAPARGRRGAAGGGRGTRSRRCDRWRPTCGCSATSPTRQLAELYRRCALFCYPSLGEGFGLPLLEAMAAGLRRSPPTCPRCPRSEASASSTRTRCRCRASPPGSSRLLCAPRAGGMSWRRCARERAKGSRGTRPRRGGALLAARRLLSAESPPSNVVVGGREPLRRGARSSTGSTTSGVGDPRGGRRGSARRPPAPAAIASQSRPRPVAPASPRRPQGSRRWCWRRSPARRPSPRRAPSRTAPPRSARDREWPVRRARPRQAREHQRRGAREHAGICSCGSESSSTASATPSSAA